MLNSFRILTDIINSYLSCFLYSVLGIDKEIAIEYLTNDIICNIMTGLKGNTTQVAELAVYMLLSHQFV